MIYGFSTPYRLDITSNGAGILLYIKEDTLSCLAATEKGSVESFYVELHCGNKKYLINCSCNPYKMIINKCLVTLEKFLDLHF